MRPVLILLLALLFPAVLPAAQVVHMAPDFSFPAVGTKARSLRSARPQPVVLIIADSNKIKFYRKQIALLRKGYQRFAARQTLFVMAMLDGSPVESNVPFLLANNPAAVAKAYGAQCFAVAIIGRDGNLDYETGKPVTPERIIDVIQNAAPVQEESRAAASR
jgi:hypothetical protein